LHIEQQTEFIIRYSKIVMASFSKSSMNLNVQTMSLCLRASTVENMVIDIFI